MNSDLVTTISETSPLRPYQREAVDAILRAHDRGESNGLLTLPTGTGKTRIAGEVLRTLPGRALVVCHTTELGVQLQGTLADYLDEPVGLVSGGRVHGGDTRVVVGLRQSLTGATLLSILVAGAFETLVIDEAHRAIEGSTYAYILDGLQTLVPGLFVLGLTATPWRESGMQELLCDRFWFSREIADLIPQGVLAPVTHETLELPIALRKVRLSGSGENRDYSAKAIEPKLLAVAGDLAARVLPLIARRTHVVIFAVTVKHAQAIAAALNRADPGAVAVWGGQESADRARAMHAWRNGEKAVLVNVGIVSEGFDEPRISAIVFARPTASTTFYLQALGRGLRTSPGKADCLVIDCVGLGGLRDPRQCLLDSIVPEVATLGGEQSPAAYAGRKVMRDPRDDAGRLWHRIEADIYALALAPREWLFTARHPGDGLWRTTLVENDRCTEPFGPAPFVTVAGWVRELLRDRPKHFFSADASWRSDEPTPAQYARLGRALAGIALRDGWSRGRASDEITVRNGRSVARRFISPQSSGGSADDGGLHRSRSARLPAAGRSYEAAP